MGAPDVYPRRCYHCSRSADHNCVLGITQGDEGCTWQSIGNVIGAYYLWIVLSLWVVLALFLSARLDKRLYEARNNFALIKSVKELSPEDLNFQVLEPGE